MSVFEQNNLAQNAPAAIGPLDVLVAKTQPGNWRQIGIGIAAFLAIAILWSAIAQLDEVSIATGRVAPKGQVKIVQHLEGGIIADLPVADGDRVSEGDILVRLSETNTSMNAEELAVKLDGLALTEARLQAEANGTELVLPDDIAARQPGLAAAERQSFAARQDELNGSLSLAREQVQQRRLEVEEQQSELASAKQDLILAREAMKMSASLQKDQLVSRLDMNTATRDVERNEGRVNTLSSSLPRSQAALAEAEAREANVTHRFRAEASDLARQVALERARTQEQHLKAADQRSRTAIMAPTDGIVQNLRFHTVGGVVGAGEPIMDIVPIGDRLVVEAKLSPVDIGYVRVGQKATVKLTTYDFLRYGALDGTVILVGADSQSDKSGEPYYKVIVETDKNYIGEEDAGLDIMPGMDAQVDIHIGERSLLNYLIQPVLKLRAEAFRER